jgi:hypothetical protein
VWPCSSEKLLIYELETYRVPDTCYVTYGWALTKVFRIIKYRVCPIDLVHHGCYDIF